MARKKNKRGRSGGGNKPSSKPKQSTPSKIRSNSGGGGGGNKNKSSNSTPAPKRTRRTVHQSLSPGQIKKFNNNNEKFVSKLTKKSPKSGTSMAAQGKHKDGLTSHNLAFNDKGLMSYKNGKVNFQNNTALHKLGFKDGDKMFTPGEMFGDSKTTGRGRLSGTGNFIPETFRDVKNPNRLSKLEAKYGGNTGGGNGKGNSGGGNGKGNGNNKNNFVGGGAGEGGTDYGNIRDGKLPDDQSYINDNLRDAVNNLDIQDFSDYLFDGRIEYDDDGRVKEYTSPKLERRDDINIKKQIDHKFFNKRGLSVDASSDRSMFNDAKLKYDKDGVRIKDKPTELDFSKGKAFNAQAPGNLQRKRLDTGDLSRYISGDKSHSKTNYSDVGKSLLSGGTYKSSRDKPNRVTTPDVESKEATRGKRETFKINNKISDPKSGRKRKHTLKRKDKPQGEFKRTNKGKSGNKDLTIKNGNKNKGNKNKGNQNTNKNNGSNNKNTNNNNTNNNNKKGRGNKLQTLKDARSDGKVSGKEAAKLKRLGISNNRIRDQRKGRVTIGRNVAANIKNKNKGKGKNK
jgi:hypothetical protein